ncbi:DUF1345 domain-containing protein [Subtercola sp. RTI3]|uniref:DUF1345 domain-containing protein n=1 Tax=Subtercola sp. RTI3 TaxID=3048639 RepID=UPI002B23A705|nr:DUF1345 domain-containing protein [Subtercola sp. RTI3]MEA9984279.1 DUF1345 domain-containing protein [Subtercola sp. RTI3]
MTQPAYNTIGYRAGLRLAVMAAVGLAVGLSVGFFASWTYAPALGWGAAATTFLVWVWAQIRTMGPGETAAHATREDPSRFASHALVLLAVVASFGGVALLLIEATNATGIAKASIILLALLTITLSWLITHTLFTLRYAAEYYRSGSGVSFNQDQDPRYTDFAYLAFTVGMTFQVSDTDIKNHLIRATILRHALLSYLLGALVLATTINLISGLSAH